jgi:hypothetical protein
LIELGSKIKKSPFPPYTTTDVETCRKLGFRDPNGKTKQGLRISTFIVKMFERKLFKPIPERIKQKLDYSFKHEVGEFHFERPIAIPDKKYFGGFFHQKPRNSFHLIRAYIHQKRLKHFLISCKQWLINLLGKTELMYDIILVLRN